MSNILLLIYLFINYTQDEQKLIRRKRPQKKSSPQSFPNMSKILLHRTFHNSQVHTIWEYFQEVKRRPQKKIHFLIEQQVFKLQSWSRRS